MKDYTLEQHMRGRDARIKGASLGHHLTEQLRINEYNRMVRALRELHEKQEAEREAERIKRELAGLPPLPPPVAVEVAKSTKGERSRTKKPEAPPLKPSRTKSNPDPKTEYTNALDQKYIRGQTWRAHDMVKGLKIDALAKSAKAQTIAAQLAAAVVDERKSLATTHTDIGEAALKAKSEAAYIAEARAQSLKASASKFDGVEERARTSFAQKLTETRNKTYANHERRENKNFISRWGGQIFSLGIDRKNQAWNANLTELVQKWSYIAREGRNLEDSVKHISFDNISNDDVKAISKLLGKALHMLENTSGDNDVEADKIIGLINEAQSIKLASDEAQKLRNKAGFKRTKKHRKKRRKTRNNITNKFVAQKH
jgi:hypothetical protein